MKSVLMVFAAYGAISLPVSAMAQVAGDAQAGKKAFIQCQACHSVDAKGPSRMGPSLHGVYGAKIASRPGYSHYSKALSGTQGKWDDAKLDLWLTRPTKFATGTSMAFAGIPDPKRRADVIAYLKTLK